MTDDLVKRADEALKDVTPGPWHPTADESAVQVKGFPILESADYVIVGLEGFYDDYDTDWANARFIAAARELVPAMRDRIEDDSARVSELQREITNWKAHNYDLLHDLDALKARVKELEGEVKRAFAEGFVAGAGDGWVNNPRMGREWKNSRARAALEGEKTDG